MIDNALSSEKHDIPSTRRTLSPTAIDELNTRFEDAAPQDILRWAVQHFDERLAVVTSFQHTGVVTLHMLQEIAPDVPVLTLDTGLLFAETLVLMDRLEREWQLRLHRLRPNVDEIEIDQMWESDPDRCCEVRKTRPLARGLAPYDAWITGLRRDQSATRAHTPIVAADPRHPGKLKIAPFANWTADMIALYVNAHELPYNALYDQGYPSIGCWPCTRPVAPDEDSRAGRWAGRSKTECGIHVSPSS